MFASWWVVVPIMQPNVGAGDQRWPGQQQPRADRSLVTSIDRGPVPGGASSSHAAEAVMHCRYSDLAADTTRTFSTHFLESFACRTRNCINKQFSITPEDHCTLLNINNSYYYKVHQSGNVMKITALTRTAIRESSPFLDLLKFSETGPKDISWRICPHSDPLKSRR